MKERVLVVEDELGLRETLVYNLQHQGYQVDFASDGNEAVQIARQVKPDLILLDIMLPGIDGFEVCRILRQDMNVPIIFLTARDDEVDRVIGLEIGGDDYVSKPFSMRELIARVKGMFRRDQLIRQEKEAQEVKQQDDYLVRVYGNLTIDEKRREIRIDGTPVAHKPKEYELLMFFAEHRGRVLSREFILSHVWDYDYIGESRTVDVHVCWLREKIEKDPSNPTRIITVRGGGYRFEG